MKIPVVFATDENYIFYTCVAITSLSRSADPDTVYEVYILTGDEFTDQGLLKIAEQKYSNINLKVVKADTEIFKNVIINNSHVTKTTFYRLLLCNLIQEEKCIYLDSDIIVTEDLQALYSVNLDGHYVAGCRDIWIDMMSEEERDNRRKRTEIPSMQEYVNAGILVMNLRKIREDGQDKVFLQHLNKDYLFEDQDIINVCCYGKIKHLPAKWNIYTLFLGLLDEMRAKGIGEDVLIDFKRRKGIIHYATPFIRPWEYFHCWANIEWWEMAAEWKEESCFQRLKEKVRKKEESQCWTYYLKKCDKCKKVIIFGYTFYGKQVCDWLLNSGLSEKLMFCDNNFEKWHQSYKGINVIPLEAAERKDILFINASQARKEEVSKLLIKSGIKEEDIICYTQKRREYYQYLDNRYYMAELQDIFLRECGARWSGLQKNLPEMRRMLLEEEKYQEWHSKYFMKDWILKEELY